MIISLNWLKKYTGISVSPEALADTLTFLGIEVEEIIRDAAEISGVAAAKVLSTAPHPDADKLTVCRVTDGSEESQVVCGAPNVAQGQMVLLAKPGARLAGGAKLKKSKIRGVDSFGMICAEDEIGLGKGHAGIMVLPPDTSPGTPLREVPGLCDTIMELSVTPNRPDVLCHIGVAREIAAFYGQPLLLPALKQEHTIVRGVDDFNIRITAPEDCSLYTGRIIRNVEVGPSPAWLSAALEKAGQKSINNIVDITNYTLLEFGQPSHVFDLDKIAGKDIFICRGKSGMSLETLDGIRRNIGPEDLIIADQNGPLCLAGVMGGTSTMVTEQTRNIFLETAYFLPAPVRRQAKRHGLITDSSYRFERGVDPLNVTYVSHYISELIAKVSGGRPDPLTVAEQTAGHPAAMRSIRLRPSRVHKVLGAGIPGPDIISMLGKIEIRLKGQGDDFLEFEAPGFRPDLEREIDLIEEVARLYNFNNIPPVMPVFPVAPVSLPPMEKISTVIRHHLSSQGLFEGLSLRFTSFKHSSKLELPPAELEKNAVRVANPLSEEWEILPVTPLISLLNAVVHNQNIQETHCRIFEIGKRFINRPELLSDHHPGVLEEDALALVLSGEWESNSWNRSGAAIGFHDIKGLLENLFKALKFPFITDSKHQVPWLHPSESAAIVYDGNIIGHFGMLHPRVKANFEIKQSCGAAEISLALLARHSGKSSPFRPFKNISGVTREMNIIVDEKVTHGDLLAMMPLSSVKYLEEVRLNSIYRGKGTEPGKKAMHYSFIYRHPERSLTDDEVNKIQEKLAAGIAKHPEISFK